MWMTQASSADLYKGRYVSMCQQRTHAHALDDGFVNWCLLLAFDELFVSLLSKHVTSSLLLFEQLCALLFPHRDRPGEKIGE